jgi:hypothetical protein
MLLSNEINYRPLFSWRLVPNLTRITHYCIVHHLICIYLKLRINKYHHLKNPFFLPPIDTKQGKFTQTLDLQPGKIDIRYQQGKEDFRGCSSAGVFQSILYFSLRIFFWRRQISPHTPSIPIRWDNWVWASFSAHPYL